MMPLLDTTLIRRRRHELRLSQRQLARQIGVSAPTVARIEDGHNHAELTLGTVHALAQALTIDITSLYPQDDSGDDRANDSEDAARVGAALQQEQALTPIEAIAAAYGWTLERTRDAIDQLGQAAPTVGLRVHEQRRQVTLVPAVEAVEHQQLQALAQSRYGRNELNLTEARVVAALIDGADSRQLQGNATQVALGRLRNAGYVTDHDTPQLTSPVLYSLMLDKD